MWVLSHRGPGQSNPTQEALDLLPFGKTQSLGLLLFGKTLRLPKGQQKGKQKGKLFTFWEVVDPEFGLFVGQSTQQASCACSIFSGGPSFRKKLPSTSILLVSQKNDEGMDQLEMWKRACMEPELVCSNS